MPAGHSPSRRATGTPHPGRCSVGCPNASCKAGVSGIEPPAPSMRFDGLEVDLGRRLVTLQGDQLRLTPTEYQLLEAFVTNPGKLLTHQWLLRRVWGQGYGTETTYLRTYVRTLRKKLGDDASAPALIVTEPGVGYRWIGEPDG